MVEAVSEDCQRQVTVGKAICTDYCREECYDGDYSSESSIQRVTVDKAA